MIRTSRSQHGCRRARVREQAGFTLIELLVVVIVIAILIGLLLPVIAGAMRTANNAATQAEVNQLAQALASFKSTYGDYPPSRMYLSENGVFPVGNTTQVNGDSHDITVGALAQRSLIAMRKFFPRVVFGTSSVPPQIGANFWYDFNGNGKLDGPYIIQGDECLVFFLGGITFQDPTTGAFAMTGFGKDPLNPFTNNLATDPNYNGGPNPMYSANRQSPSFEFNAGRLFLDPNNPSVTLNQLSAPNIPGYYDTLGNAPPSIATSTVNFYVYFSGYGNGVYDANDVNFLSETDAHSAGPIGLQFQHAGVIYPSIYPNPYTLSKSTSTSGTVSFEKAQTFQIFSPGRDGLYGVGGQFVAPTAASASSSTALPYDGANTFAGYNGTTATPTTDALIRKREGDNLTNFQSGTLQ
jgi:prepilin-type N-terminal cleavage/methylation domain-containing protein